MYHQITSQLPASSGATLCTTGKSIPRPGYAWWIERIKYQLTVTDFLRIDHFRGFDRYWAVPYGEETAINGEWKPAPGLNFFTQLEANLGYHLPIIAEDLGEIDDSVIELRDKFGLPGNEDPSVCI